MIRKIWNYIWRLWFSFPQSVRFILVGGFCAVFAYGVFCALVYFVGEQWRQICLIIQWILTSFITYILYRFFVFQSHGKIWAEYLKCCTTWIIGYFINVVALEIFFQSGLNIYMAQLSAQAIAAIVSYFAFKYWALKKE